MSFCVVTLWSTLNKDAPVKRKYTKEHVLSLKAQVGKYFPLAPFFCLTNEDCSEDYFIRMKSDFPGWWGKLEVFALPDRFKRILFLDLDTIICGDISFLAENTSEFLCIKDFNAPFDFNSSLMLFNNNYLFIYDKFALDAEKYMSEYTTRRKWGDQGFIRDNLEIVPDYFQDLYPNKIKSASLDLKYGLPDNDVCMVNFHGNKKPWDLPVYERFLL